MKKIYLILCILGTILPYYNLYKFLELNNWSMEGFWGLLYENYAVSMISYDLSIAALTFLIYIIYTCLLYTSPSPRDRQKSRMPSSA